MPPIDLCNRPPTVQRYQSKWWPFGRKTSPIAKAKDAAPTGSAVPASPAPTAPKPAPQKSASPSDRTLFGWLIREAIALVGVTGAALTVLAQLAWYVRMSPPFMDALGSWMTMNSNFWLSYYDDLGFYPHAHLQAAVALAVFLALIGLGARVSAILAGSPLDRRWSLFEGMTWPSLAIMGVLAVVFLLGHDPAPSSATYDGAGGQETVKYLFAIILATGYGLGDYLGQRGFHTRLYRLAILLVLLLGLNHWLLISP
jgi:hypothetical protein